MDGTMLNLNNKSILVVGSAGSLKDSGLGDKIDEFDIVIRVNLGKTIGYEKDVGTKHTIWSSWRPADHYISLDPREERNEGLNKKQIEDVMSELKEIWYVSSPVIRDSWKQFGGSWRP
ncbi:MAG: hypothetical protein GF350_02615, partial [Chitinivibrionales bacterium]|nr:hypothetical protein [Chitinivibrionales bacterium]